MREVVILDGVRTPFLKADPRIRRFTAVELGRQVLESLFRRVQVPTGEVDEVIMGCVGQVPESVNVARIAAVKAGLPAGTPAFTVQRNCASAMQAVSSAVDMVGAGSAEVVVAGGTESMSCAPLLFREEFAALAARSVRARTVRERLRILTSFRPRMLKPRSGLLEGLTDPFSGGPYGAGVDEIARRLGIGREEQDGYALESNRRAAAARDAGRLATEISPLRDPRTGQSLSGDDGIREDRTLEDYGRLAPVFDRRDGTVTAGNSCQVSDGAVAMIVTTMERAEGWGLKPLARVAGYRHVGLESRLMALGPVAATAKLLGKLGRELREMDLVELNEAFAAQVLACRKVFASANLCSDLLGLASAPGELDPSRLNVNGGAIALGHPVGSTGGRLLLTLALELGRRNAGMGLATACVGGGQGAAFVLERSSRTR